MDEDRVRIRVRVGANEAEIEASGSSIKDVINMIPEMVQRLPYSEETVPRGVTSMEPSIETLAPYKAAPVSSPQAMLPEIKVDKTDSLTDVITKIFMDRWGRQPRKLSEVREVLESYGLIYPKQSVAVTLLRLAQSGRLRRFKGEDGDFVYTASTGLTVEAASGEARGLGEIVKEG